MRRFALIAVLLPTAVCSLAAQTRTGAPEPMDGGASQTLQSVYIQPMPNAPFTLTLATEWVQPLGADGNTVTVVNERTIARDRAGRVYQQRVLLRPANLTGPYITNLIQVNDPATHTTMNCFVLQKQCETVRYNAPLTSPDLQTGTVQLDGGTEQRKNLGKDIMDGVEVVGMHVTTVVDAGMFGNAKPVTIEREFWYSPTLGINLRSMRDDPRSGKQSFTVKKLSLDEPDVSLWQVPAGYTMVGAAPAAKQ